MGVSIITEVLTPAASGLLTTLARVKDDWMITDSAADAFLLRAVERASGEIANYCNREFGVRSLRDTVFPDRDSYPYQVPGGVAPLQVSAWPIIAVTSVTENDIELIAGTDYIVNADLGHILRLGAFNTPTTWPAVKLVVEYSAGYVLPGDAAVEGAQTLPAPLEDAASRMVWARYAERRRDPFVKAETVEGVGSTTYWIPGGDTGNMPPDIADLVDNFRVPVAV